MEKFKVLQELIAFFIDCGLRDGKVNGHDFNQAEPIKEIFAISTTLGDALYIAVSLMAKAIPDYDAATFMQRDQWRLEFIYGKWGIPRGFSPYRDTAWNLYYWMKLIKIELEKTDK